ncbi:MCE family protein [Amycolatopsis sp. NPDC059027]|uniref:MCE family protein n=1 Tax=unclassified Amycolatopsis TaxID=2618356 RepID=UPI00366CD681
MRRLQAGLGFALTATLLAGCGVSLQNLDVGRDVDGPSYELTAVFGDVSGLPIGGQVKLGPTAVGRVVSARSENFQAHVVLRLRDDVRLPKGTRAELKLSTALGDQYVDLQPPPKPGPDILAAGAVIPVADTARGPDIENTLAVLGTVLNNSGLDQARTIITELNTILGGREDKIRDLLARSTTILTTLDNRTADFKRTLDSLNRLSKVASDNKELLDTAFARITPAVNLLRSQQDSLTAMLASLPPLAKSADETLGRTKDTLGGIARDLGPVLDRLSGFSGSLGATLGTLKSVTALAGKAIPGDYLDLNLTLDVPKSLISLFSPIVSAPPPDGAPAIPLPGGLGQLLLGGTR